MNVHRNRPRKRFRDAQFEIHHPSQYIALSGQNICSSKSAEVSILPTFFYHRLMVNQQLIPAFSQLFGEDNADEEVSPDTADPEAGADAGQNALDSEATKEGNVERVSTKKWAKNCEYDPEKLFNKFFYDDIQYLLSMANLWKDRTPPRPTKWGDFAESGTSGAVSDQSLNHNQKIWSLRECGDVFAESVAGLKKTFGKLADDDHLVWDKDDKDGMDFVAACANIRANVFGIGQKSRFEIKCMSTDAVFFFCLFVENILQCNYDVDFSRFSYGRQYNSSNRHN